MLKQRVKRKFCKYNNWGFNSNLEYVMSQAEVISFDIFDTLVKRNIPNPRQVHEIVEKKFYSQTGIEICEYTKKRTAAEKKARKISIKEEVSLEDIFDVLLEIPNEWKKKLQILEKQTEIEICTPSLKMKPKYIKALQDGKKIIITSDMYLDQETIEQILAACGYVGYDRLYLSSSLGVSKATGRIFDIIKYDYAMFSGRILHVGDNIKSDYFLPKVKGISSALIDGRVNTLRFWKQKDKRLSDQLLYQRLYSFLNNHIYDNSNDALSIGYEILGPMLCGFCKWLYEKIEINKIDKLFFLSREGKIIQEAFNILYPECNVKQTYLYVSRQALVIPLLVDADNFDKMIDTFKLFAHIPVVSIIPEVCLFDLEIFNKEIKKINLSGETRIDTLSDEKKQKLYSIIMKLGKGSFIKQKEFIIRYLKENNLKGNIAIVDIGWSGTMQQALKQYLRETNTIIYGYYLGVRDIKSSDYYAGLFREGYLFDCGKNEDFNLMTRFTSGIIEMLFLNMSGSVLRYRIEGKSIVPVLSESEYVGMEGDFITAVQLAALDFLNIIRTDKLFMEYQTISEDIIMTAYSRFAVYPTLATLKIFEKFRFLNGKIRMMLPEQGVFYYLTHIRELNQDFRDSSCKILFLKKILKLNLPYFTVLKFLLCKWNKKKRL